MSAERAAVMRETVEEYVIRLLRETLPTLTVEKLDGQRRYLESLGDAMSPVGVPYSDLLDDVEAEIVGRYDGRAFGISRAVVSGARS